VVLLDFEAVAVARGNGISMPTAVARERFRLSASTYREFSRHLRVRRAHLGRLPVAEIRELTMTTWLMQNVGSLRQVAAEFALRVASLRERDTRRVWTAF
jgi:hypothetical protein